MAKAADERRGSAVLVTGDLIFSTKITGTARQLGLSMTVVDSPDSVEVVPGQTRLILLDLGLESIRPEHIRTISAAAPDAALVAYGSHVEAERLQSARDAGCTEVLPRSRLATALPDLLKRYMR